MNYFVYILKCADDTLYTGITTDLERRVAEHNTSPKGAKYTSGRRPVVLVYSEEPETKGAALTREHNIKKMSRGEKMRLIKGG